MKDTRMCRRDYKIHCGLLSYLIVLICLLGTDVGFGCVVEERHHSPYVTASYERFPPLSGCLSQETGSKNKEQVHAVVLTGNGRKNQASPLIVNVILRSSSQDPYDGRNQFFLLLSSRPVIWRLHPPKRLANNFIGKFLISNGSHIERMSEDRIRLREKHLRRVPGNGDPTELLTWMREKWSVVTSFLHLDFANFINIDVGKELTSTAERCVFQPALANHVASLLQIQDTKGCTASPHQLKTLDSDVHIVELLRGGDSDSLVGGSNPWRVREPSEVIVNLRPRARRPLTTHLVLVLKSHQPVKWTVTTQNLRGTLDIITDQLVNSSEVNLHTLRIAAETLTGYTGQSLVRWTGEKYGQALSYTVAPLANHFDIITDGADGLYNSGIPSQKDSTSNRKSSSREQEQDLVTAQQSPMGFEPEVSGLRVDASTTEPTLDELKMAVIHATRAHCSNNQMKISISKQLHLVKQLASVREGDITLRDPMCKSTYNGTHFQLFTALDACLTQRSASPRVGSEDNENPLPSNSAPINNGDNFLYRNTIMLHYATDDSAARNKTLMVNVTCDLSGEARQDLDTDTSATDEGGLLTEKGGQAGGVQFQLNVYRDSAFTDQITSYPQPFGNGEFIYVEATILSKEVGLRVVATDCSVNSESLNNDESLYSDVTQHRILVDNRCPIDPSVTWLDERGGGERFRFKARGVVCPACVEVVQLTCRLLLCTDMPSLQRDLKLAKCPLRQQQGCLAPRHLQQTVASDWTTVAANISCGPITVNPPQLIISTNNTGNSRESGSTVDTNKQKSNEEPSAGHAEVLGALAALENSENGSSEPCEQIVHVLGLDSLTVVGIAFASFFIGVALVACIWFIYVKTARRPVKNKGGITVVGGVVAGAIGAGRISADSSGDSTPCSTAPITVKHHMHT